jgi:hypothetical protein
VLPHWPAGTVTILATADETPHAIPVSAALRAGPTRALVALAGGRDSLARLRGNPSVALAIVARGTAITAHGSARVIEEELVEGVAAVEIDVEWVQDHGRPSFEIETGVAWRWTDAEAAERDRDVRAALERLASRSV